MKSITNRGENHQSYKGLPPLAGIATMPETTVPGLSIDDCVSRLKRFHYAFKRLHQIFNARIPSEPVYELKMAFSLHSHLCAEHVASLRKRVGEMREPPLGLNKVPHPALEAFFDEILQSPTSEENIAGIYAVALPALQAGMTQHIDDTNPLADHPSVRVCRFALLELSDMVDYGEKAVDCLIDASTKESMAEWVDHLQKLLDCAGGLDGASEASDESLPLPVHSAGPYEFNGKIVRDKRFHDPYNMGVNAEAYLYNPDFDDTSKVLMMFYKRIREIDVPEMMASIIAETEGKPWDYYRDMTRQLWDEARHAMMGEVGFTSLGMDWSKVPVNFTWSLGLNSQLEPLERHAVLYYIEQGLMSKTGKRYEWEVGVASENPLASLFQDYDWADEVLHSHIGRTWYVSEIGDAKKAIEYGDACWSKVLMDWQSYKDQGLTEHHNWWPEIYQEACDKAGISPEPAQLAYDTSYAEQRADLKTLPAE